MLHKDYWKEKHAISVAANYFIHNGESEHLLNANYITWSKMSFIEMHWYNHQNVHQQR